MDSKKESYVQAREFAFSDIERELHLAGLTGWKKYLASKIGIQGGGNFLAALGLMCYVEYFGKYIAKPGASNRATFDEFFKYMGKDYANLLTQVRVYNIFRCGLAHEYFVKGNCEVVMFGETLTGLGIKKDGSYYFCVDKFFNDFRKAALRLEEQLFT